MFCLLRIFCNTVCYFKSEIFVGKSVEKFQDALKVTMTRLRRRHPSVLFLDDLDILFHRQDEDIRNIRLERCTACKSVSSSCNQVI